MRLVPGRYVPLSIVGRVRRRLLQLRWCGHRLRRFDAMRGQLRSLQRLAQLVSGERAVRGGVRQLHRSGTHLRRRSGYRQRLRAQLLLVRRADLQLKRRHRGAHCADRVDRRG
jgi:hypothetical protein